MHKWPGKYLNGTATAGAYAGNVRTNFTKVRQNLNPWLFSQKASVPDGYNLDQDITASIKTGDLSAFTTLAGEGSLTADAILAKLSEATLAGVGDLTADLSVISPMEAALSGSGSVSAALEAVSNMAAALSGTGSLSADLSSTLPMEAALSGTGTVASSTNLTGTGRLEADITPFTDLSPEGLAAALLDNNDIETDYSLRETLRLIVSALAGKVSGAGGTTITIRDINDTVDRIVATVDSNGNRSAVTKDVT